MPNQRDYDREYDRYDRGYDKDADRSYDRRESRSKLFESLDEQPTDRPQREQSFDRGGFAPLRRPYDRATAPAEEFSPRYNGREERAPYSDYPGSGNVALFAPKSFSDVQGMIEHLRRNEPIIVDLEGVEQESAQRVLDFLSGASYALGGSMRRVKDMTPTFLITPSGTGIMDTNDDRSSR